MSPLSDAARATIRARRIEKGYTQPKAAEAAGISITTWNSIEKGRSSGAALARAAICRLLGWSPDSIERLERGDKPLEHVYGGGAEDEVGPAEAQAADDVIGRLSEQDEKIAQLERAVRRLAGDQLLGG